jgi:competence protein ComEC
MTSGFATLTGVLLGLAAARQPHAWWLLGSAAVVLLVFFVKSLRQRTWVRMLAMLLAAMTLTTMSTAHWLSLRVAVPAADSRVLVDARVLTVPARAINDLRFDAQVQVLEGALHDLRVRRARLSWRDAATAPRVGERWRLLVRLEPLADTHNFVGMDLERIAIRDRVHLAGRVLPSALNTRLELADSSVDTLRARVAARIADQVADRDAAALLTALAVGLTDGMSADQWRVFNATGTTHLVAISGLHVTLFALLALFFARRLWRWMPGAKFFDREPFAYVVGLAAAGAYAQLAGFSVPTQRTWLMLAIFALAKLTARHSGVGRTWSLALIAVLLLDPFAPLSAGFWLSFVAVGVILIVESTSLIGASRALGALRLQLAVMLALAPLTFAVFGGVSISGLWVNLAAIPIVSFVLVPLVLAGALTALWAPGLCSWFFGAAATLYEWLWPGMVWAADVTFAQWRVSPPMWWFGFALIAGVLLLRRWPWALRATAACALLPLLFAPSRMPAEGQARVSVLDAGRGTLVLVATRSHVLLFDTGDSWNAGGARVRQLVLPLLDSLAHKSVDLLLLPGLNEDRARGAALLASERGVGQIVVGGGWPATSLAASTCADTSFHWEGVDFTTFAAGSAGRHCVLRIATGAHAVLLPGDLDAAAERQLKSRLAAGALASDVVLMSRQASALGSSAQWIEASHARVAIATGGVEGSNSRAQAIERWRSAGADIQDTRRDGGIELLLGTNGVRVLREARGARYPFAWRRTLPSGGGVRYDPGPCGKSFGPAAHSCGRSSSARSQPSASFSRDSGLCSANASCPKS